MFDCACRGRFRTAVLMTTLLVCSFFTNALKVVLDCCDVQFVQALLGSTSSRGPNHVLMQTVDPVIPLATRTKHFQTFLPAQLFQLGICDPAARVECCQSLLVTDDISRNMSRKSLQKLQTSQPRTSKRFWGPWMPRLNNEDSKKTTVILLLQ